jgi:hypothetical protein
MAPSEATAVEREARAREGLRQWGLLARLCAGALLVAALLYVLDPMLSDFSTYGFHDWDVETAYRYITPVSLRAGEGPWWHPWLCGGVPGFGYPEVATNLVSPYLPLYLFADVRTAIRFEVLGQGLLGLAGTYAFASLFTESVALSTLLTALFVLNGRWALQAAVGHTWHLQYALMPWAFFFFERSLRGKKRWAVAAGLAMALCAYWGGVYPLPHTALLLALYACLLALFERTRAPLVSLVIAGASALGLGAPKLFAVADQMSAIPRLIESTEVIGPSALLAMLTAPGQRYGVRSADVPAYNWHEWGIYIGWGGMLVLALALFARGPRGHAFKILGILCFLLGFGAFHTLAPWALLHRLPMFASQHVPSRFFYPMLLMLGAAFVMFAAPHLDPRVRRSPWLDVVLLVPVALFACDMVRFSQTPFEQAFWMQAPPTIRRAPLFEQRLDAPIHYVRRDWAQPILLSMFANTGVVRCYGVDPNFTPGAIPRGDSDYAGLAFIEGGRGTARVVDWGPSHAVVDVTDGTPGALLVYDMNHDPSWRANGAPALEHRGLVSARLRGGSERIELRYFPRTFRWSLPLFGLAVLGCLWQTRWNRFLITIFRSKRRARP